MKFCIVKFRGKYLVETPDWNSGVWTDDVNQATRYQNDGFFQKYYPQFEVVEVEA